jgi:predicted O-methyltransferase YrrM
MFHNLTDSIKSEMARLEALDAQDRVDGTPRLERLRQIPPVTGQFIAIMAASAPEGEIVEIGTSAGYSTMWLARAAQETGQKLTTYEILPEKATMARETFRAAEIESLVTLVEGDALERLSTHTEIGCCFLDAEKEVYQACYDLVIPNMVPGGILLADNAINHEETLRPMLRSAHDDPRVDALVVPIGKGVLCCRKLL